MRLFIGHRLPLGFYGGVSFHPGGQLHRDGTGSQVPGVISFLVLGSLIAWLILGTRYLLGQ